MSNNSDFDNNIIKEVPANFIIGDLNERFDKLSLEELTIYQKTLDLADNMILSKTWPNYDDAPVIERQTLDILPLTLIKNKNDNFYVAIEEEEPALDPTNPEYNQEEYASKLLSLENQVRTYYELITSYNYMASIKLNEMAGRDFKNHSLEIFEAIDNIKEWAKKTLPGVDWEILPYVLEEIDKSDYKKTPDKTLLDLQNSPQWEEILENARKAQRQGKDAGRGKPTKDYPLIRSKELSMPFLNFNPFLVEARDEINGQIKLLEISADTKENGKLVKLSTFYSISFSESLPPEIDKMLNNYDRLVYGAIQGLRQAQGDLMTLPQIHRAMGMTGSMKQSQKKELWNSLNKMRGAFIWFKFDEERKHYRNSAGYENIGSGELGAALLNFKARRNWIINGNPVDDAIQILDDLPLYEAASTRRHITKIPIECIQLPGSTRRSERNLAIMFFVLERISFAKKYHEANTKLTYEELEQRCGLAPNSKGNNARAERKRIIDALIKYLDHLKGLDYIKSYEEEKKDGTRGIIIKLPEPSNKNITQK